LTVIVHGDKYYSVRDDDDDDDDDDYDDDDDDVEF
jgi:hypothetical protein